MKRGMEKGDKALYENWVSRLDGQSDKQTGRKLDLVRIIQMYRSL